MGGALAACAPSHSKLTKQWAVTVFLQALCPQLQPVGKGNHRLHCLLQSDRRATWSLEESEPSPKRVRKRGHRSWRPQGGAAKQEKKGQGAGMGKHRMHRLREQAFCDGEAVCSDAFSMHSGGLASSTGWQGHTPPKKMQDKLKKLHRSRWISESLGIFFPIPYPMPPQ
jgi:hypothetical protein